MARDIDIDQRAPAHQLHGYRAWPLAPRAGELCDLIWLHQAAGEATRHRFLPFVEPSLILRVMPAAASGTITDVDLLVGSAFPDAGWYDEEPGELLIGLRLAPETCAYAVGLSPRDFRHLAPQPASHRLREAFSQFLSVAGSIPISGIAAMFHRKLGEVAGEAPQGRAQYAIAAMRRSAGRLSCHALAHRLGLSDRQLRRYFVDEVGSAPKSYAKRLRFTRAIIEAERATKPNWADIASKAGFADQAHLIRDCQSLMGTTPEKLFQERRGGVRFVQ